MKAKTAKYLIISVMIATVAITFVQPTVIHQLVVWVSGMFAVLVTLALFMVGNWRVNAVQSNNYAEGRKGWRLQEQDTYIIKMTHSYRLAGYSDENIAIALNTDIDVIKAIP